MDKKTMKNSIPAIVLGCHKLGLGIIRALGEKGVPVVGVYYNKRDMGQVSRYVCANYQSPHPDHDEKGFVTFLTDLASKWEGAVLMPSDDATLIPVSKHKGLLENYFKVSACDWSITEKYIDKKYTYALADEVGVASPKTFLPKDINEAIEYLKILGSPCLLKPSVGHTFFEIFRKKMILIENGRQLEDAYWKINKSGMEMMLQEYIPGDDTSGVNYNSYFVDNEPLIEFTAEKVRLSPPGTGFPRVIKSKYIPQLFKPGRKMLHALGYNGFSCMEFKRDSRNGIYKFMEINGRQNLSTPLAVKCGINFPYSTYIDMAYGIPPMVSNDFKEGVYWIDMGKDIVESIRSYKRERFAISEYVKPYLNPHVYTIPSLKDSSPFFKRFSDVIKIMPKYLIEKFS